MIGLETEVFCIRIRRELKDKIRKYSDIDWRKLIEEFIEDVVARREMEEAFKRLDEILKDIPPSKEPAWKLIREDRGKL